MSIPAADVLVAHERAAMEIGELRRRGIHCHLEEHADRVARRTGAQRTQAGRGIVAAFNQAVAGGVGNLMGTLRQGVAGGVVDQIAHVLAEMGKVLADAAEERRSAAVVEW